MHTVVESGDTWKIDPPIATLFDRTTGTNIGNMTAGGASGLSGAFNGVLNQLAAGGSGISASPGWIGKRATFGRAVSKVACYGTNNVGYVNTGAVTQVTITLYGKNGTPANGTDGTALGSITFNQNAVNDTAARVIFSSDQVTTFTHVWVYIHGGAANSTYIGQLVIYEMFSAFASALLYVSLAMLGDSIIAQMAPHQAGMQIPFAGASNLGVSGNTVAQINARVGSIPAGATHVIIEGGTNDLLGLGTDAGIVPGYSAMLNAIPSTKKVIVAGIPQVDESLLSANYLQYLNNTKIAAVNAQLVTLCASYPNCTPASALMNLSMSGKTVDGIHLNAAGYSAYIANLVPLL